MKKLIVILLAVSQIFISYATNIEPEKNDNPKDTLKVYYLDDVIISSSVKETNQLKNLPTAVSVISRTIKQQSDRIFARFERRYPELFCSFIRI